MGEDFHDGEPTLQFTSGADMEFDFQLNSFVNGCTDYTCGYVWWIQGFVDVANTYQGLPGDWVLDSGIQIDQSLPNICVFSPIPPNISQYGWLIQDEFFLVSATQVTSSLTILSPNGHVYYTTTQTCTYPGTDAIAYMNQLEGVVVGASGGEHASFTPLQSEIFSGYYEMFSSYNQFSSTQTITQTGETSSLYQTSVIGGSGTYNGLYYKSFSLTENTKSDA